MSRASRKILQRQLSARKKLWPDAVGQMFWDMNNEGWVALPRLMPLMMSIMDDLAGKGVPVGNTFLELWSRMRTDENFLTLNRPIEMAFHAGFEGQRAARTWRDRMQRLETLGFISTKAGPLGDLSYVIVYNPYHVIKRAYQSGLVQENKYQALVIRANEIGADDLDQIDEQGKIVLEDVDEDASDDDQDAAEEAAQEPEPQETVKPKKVKPRRPPKGTRPSAG